VSFLRAELKTTTAPSAEVVEAFVSFLRAELKTTTAPSAEESSPERQKCTIQEEKAKREDKAKREKLEESEKPSPKRQKHEDPPTQTQLDAIRAYTEDIQVAIDAIFNAEGAPDLDDIATVVAANKNIVLLLDAINPPHTPRVQHKYAAELFDEATKRKGQQKPAPV
jgi:hypothetical protein